MGRVDVLSCPSHSPPTKCGALQWIRRSAVCMCISPSYVVFSCLRYTLTHPYSSSTSTAAPTVFTNCCNSVVLEHYKYSMFYNTHTNDLLLCTQQNLTFRVAILHVMSYTMK